MNEILKFMHIYNILTLKFEITKRALYPAEFGDAFV